MLPNHKVKKGNSKPKIKTPSELLRYSFKIKIEQHINMTVEQFIAVFSMLFVGMNLPSLIRLKLDQFCKSSLSVS